MLKSTSAGQHRVRGRAVLMATLLAFSTLLVFPAVQSQTLSSGLVGNWRFEGGSGTTAVDSSGLGNDGSLINGPNWTTGRYNGGLSFDGVDDYVKVSASSLWNPDTFSVSFWMYPRSLGGNNPPGTGSSTFIVSNGDPGDGGTATWWFEFWSDGNLEFKNCTPDCVAAHTKLTETNQWYFITGIYDGTNFNLHVDGELLSSGPNTVGDASKALLIGSGACPLDHGCGGGYFNGVIDEVRIYNGTLSASEIHAVMRDRPSGPQLLTATAGPGTGEISLDWTDPTYLGGTPIEEYEVHRSLQSGGPYNYIATTTTAGYVDSGLDGQAYYYVVKALNGQGAGSPSNQATATASGPSPGPGDGFDASKYEPESWSGNTPFTGARTKSPCNCPDAESSVNAAMGELVAKFPLMVVRNDRGADFEFTLTHRSIGNPTGNASLSYQWDASWLRHLEANGTDYLLHTGDGRSLRFTSIGGGEYEGPPGSYSKLVTSGSDLELQDRDGNVQVFSASLGYKLTSIKDPAGNHWSLQYNTTHGALEKIVDPHDRAITFSYLTDSGLTVNPFYNQTGQPLLRSITDFAGRKAVIDYDHATGHIYALKTPDSATGSTTTTRFGYDDRGIIKIWDNEDQEYLRVLYDEHGRVKAQERLNGTGATHRYAFTYAYDDGLTTVTDPEGNSVEWDFNHGATQRVVPSSKTEFTRSLRTGDLADPPEYVTTYAFNDHDELTQITFPRGNSIQYEYDETASSLYSQGNLLREVHDPGSIRALRDADHFQDEIATEYEYDTTHNVVTKIIEPRGTDATYDPQNGGSQSAARYTTRIYYDFEEATLGDLNGDGITTYTDRKPVRIEYLTVNPSGSSIHSHFTPAYKNQVVIEHLAWNQYGQLVSRQSPTGVYETYTYYPPNGKNLDASDREGYLRTVTTNDDRAPIGHWRFDEGIGGSTADTSGQANDAILINGPTWTSGKHGQALHFDGVDDYLSIDHDPILNAGSGFTAAAWINIKTDGTRKAIMEKFHEYIIRVNLDETISLFTWDGSDYEPRVQAPTPLNGNQWYHITGTWDAGTQEAKIYVDGILANTSTARPQPAPTTNPLEIGRRGTESDYFNGEIDDVRIWNRALSAAEVQALLDAPLAPTSGPVVHWQLDEGAGTSATDATGEGHGGTLLNGASWSSGKYGNALDLDGTNDYVEVPDDPALSPSEITVSAWIKPDTHSAVGNIVSKDGNHGYRFRFNPSAKISVLDRGATNAFTSAGEVAIGQWSHVAFTGDANGMHLYINGEKDANSGGPFEAPDTAGALWIGTYDTATEFFNGLIDDVRIWNRALSSDEIKTSMQKSYPGRGGVDLTTTFEYTTYGAVTKTTDPNGNVRQFAVDGRGRVTQETGPSPTSYKTRWTYDGNDNPTKLERETDAGTDTYAVREYDYDALDRVVEETVHATRPNPIPAALAGQPSPPPDSYSLQYAYDGNDNLVQRTNGAGDVESWSYDERDLLLFQSVGEGNGTYAYDDNGNLLVHEDRRGNVEWFQHDGYDRPSARINAHGTVYLTHYDPAGNVVRERGFAQGAGGDTPLGRPAAGDFEDLDASATEKQYERLYRVDEANQAYRVDEEHFFYDVGHEKASTSATLSPGDDWVTSLREYDENGQVTRIVNDNGHETTNTYDAALRLASTEDELGNKVAYAYDGNGNVVKTTETEVNDAGTTVGTYTTTYTHDSENRITDVENPDLTTRVFVYDGRGNQVKATDELGNVVKTFYDHADRPWVTRSELRSGGTGSGSLLGSVETTTHWDGADRPLRRCDDNNACTTYAYTDASGLLELETHPDGVAIRHGYDANGNRVLTTYNNGRELSLSYDESDRLVQVDVDRDQGTIGTTQQTFTYDAMGRVTRTSDNGVLRVGPLSRPTVTVTTHAYDSLGRLVAEAQNGQGVEHVRDGLGSVTATTYPNGRVVTQTYDVLERLQTVGDAKGFIAGLDYDGDRVVKKSFGSASSPVAVTTQGYDSMRRINDVDHVRGATSLVHVAVEYNDAGYRTAQHLFPGPSDELDQLVTLDSLYRTTKWERGDLDAVPTSISNVQETQSWNLDGANNWDSVARAGTTCLRNHDAGNQLTSEKCGTAPTEMFPHDDNGNIEEDDDFRYSYDFLNRLVRVDEKSSGDPLLAFGYDALGRRVVKVSSEPSGLLGGGPHVSLETWFTHSGQDVVQESQPLRADALSPAFGVRVIRQWTHGDGVDELLEMTVDRNGGTLDASDERFFYVHDAHGSVIGLTDEAGNLVEGYTYDAYGKPTTRRPGAGFSDVQWDSTDIVTTTGPGFYENPFLFTGRYWDAHIDKYHYRARTYDPELGRFLSRDPIGVWGDGLNLGNAYAYVGNSPWQYTDPYGLCPTCIIGAAAGAVAGAAIYGVAVATTDAEFSWGQFGAATAVGAGGGALIGTGVGIGAGAGAFAGISGAVVAGAGEGILTGVTLDTLDNGRVDEGVAAYASSAGAGAITGGALHGVGVGVRALRQADNAVGLRGFAGDEAATLLPGKGRPTNTLALQGASHGAGAKPHTTVLGHYPGYQIFGPDSANRFVVGDAASLTDRQLWTLNKRFLDDAIVRGDEFLLSTGPDVMRGGSFYAQELAYMQTRGFTPVQTIDGWRLVARGSP